MKMADEQQGNTTSGLSRPKKPDRTKAERVTAKPTAERLKRKSETPTITDDLTGKFLRVGNKLYRTSDDKTPIVRIAGDRLKTSNIDALPDIYGLRRVDQGRRRRHIQKGSISRCRRARAGGRELQTNQSRPGRS
jgi:hypothetical protein